MSDTTYENFCNSQMLQHRVCGVAYTLNDEQPVVCTHIGDQPLHYLDEEEILDEDDGLLNMEELEQLAQEVQTLKKEIMGLDDNSTYVESETMSIFQKFSENIDDINLNSDLSTTQIDETTRLNEIKALLSESRLASAYMNVADKYDVEIKMSEQIEKAFYDRRSGTILLHPNMEMIDQTLLLVRELRKHWQHRQGALLNPLSFMPEHAILVNRAQEADLVVSIIRIAWELQLAGKRDVWERVENSPLSDLARAFSREAFIDFRTLNNGEASTAVFEAWFLSERCRQNDKTIIQSMLSDHSGYVFKDEGSSHSITTELLAALGEMPFGKNYLGKYAHIIMEDPIFMEVRDRSSANFLWFIKFERSFKEAEQELQTDSDLSTHDVRHDLYNKSSQDQINDINYSADIVQLFEHAMPERKMGKQAKGCDSADVIDITRWSSRHS